MTKSEESCKKSLQEVTCPCGAVTVTFDPEAAKGVKDASEVRRRWPRGRCNKCRTIVYASQDHCFYGDY